jgi:ATP-binding protein involved in chromosome partitioning
MPAPSDKQVLSALSQIVDPDLGRDVVSLGICPDCGQEHHVFGHGGAERAAQRLRVPFLGGIPLAEDIRAESDSGAPIVISRPDSAGARAFRDVASQIAARTSIQSFRQLPVINIR